MQKQKLIKTITGTYTVLLADNGYAIRCNSATPFTVSLPTASGCPNFNLDLINVGSGAVTCNGVTLLSGNGIQLYCDASAWTNLKILNAIAVSDIPVMTSAEFATKISDETGSGVVVFSATPTIANPTLTTPTFGDATNNTHIEADGTLVFAGDATVYNDLPPNPIIRSRLAAANNPTLTPFVGNIEQYTFAVNDYVYDNFEVMHTYKEGSDLSVHTHWASNGGNVDDRYVKWEFEYSIANRNGGTSNTFTTSTVISQEFLIPAGTTDHTHYSSPIGTITGTDIKIGAIITYRFRRIASTGTAPTNNPFGLQMGVHCEIDQVGSRTLSTK